MGTGVSLVKQQALLSLFFSTDTSQKKNNFALFPRETSPVPHRGPLFRTLFSEMVPIYFSVAGGVRLGQSRWRVTRPRGQLEPSQELNLTGSHLLMLFGNRLGSVIELYP